MTKTCLLSGDPITSESDSRAHIIPSALGGRLNPKGLLSADANGLLNEAVDLPLIRAFEPIMSLLNGSRDRGSNPSVRMTDAVGRSYDVAFGEPLKLSTPEFSMDEQPDGSVVVQVSARTPKEMQTLLGRVRARFPHFDIEAAMQQAAVTNTRAAGKLNGRLQIGPAVTFPAAFEERASLPRIAALRRIPTLDNMWHRLILDPTRYRYRPTPSSGISRPGLTSMPRYHTL